MKIRGEAERKKKKKLFCLFCVLTLRSAPVSLQVKLRVSQTHFLLVEEGPKDFSD